MFTERTEHDYRRVEKAIEFIRDQRDRQPGLGEIAAHIHLSPYHFHRLFTRWAGISPKKFLQYLNIRYSRELLERNLSLEEVAFQTGFSGTGRLHDLFVTFEGMTPDQYRRAGAGITIRYGFHYSPFGRYILAVTGENRICSLQFIKDEVTAIRELKSQWSSSKCIHDPEKTDPFAADLFRSEPVSRKMLLARGTPFQLKVWESLLKIPAGEVVSYQLVAEHAGLPGGLQAVGSAIGRNTIAYLIPCHRVLRKTGHISEYRWGTTRKSALLGWEASAVNR